MGKGSRNKGKEMESVNRDVKFINKRIMVILRNIQLLFLLLTFLPC